MRVRLTVITMARDVPGRSIDDRPACAGPSPAPAPAIGYVAALLMRIGVPKESAAGEHRVALVPDVVGKLKAMGLDVSVQGGAGADALIPDEVFGEAGAHIASDASRGWESAVGVAIAPPEP